MKKFISINTEIDYQPNNNYDIIINELTERAELFCDMYRDPYSYCIAH